MHACALTDLDYRRLSALSLALRRSGRPERAEFLHRRLSEAVVHDASGTVPGRAGIGSSVSLTDTDDGSSYEYRLVLPKDADISLGRISVLTPLGSALLGRGVGESFCYDCPGGRINVRLDRVRHDG